MISKISGLCSLSCIFIFFAFFSKTVNAEMVCVFYKNDEATDNVAVNKFFKNYKHAEVALGCPVDDRFDILKLHRKRSISGVDIHIFWKWCTSNDDEVLHCIDQNNEGEILYFDDAMMFMSLTSEHQRKTTVKEIDASYVLTQGVRVQEFKSIMSYYQQFLLNLSRSPSDSQNPITKTESKLLHDGFLSDTKDSQIGSIIFQDYSFSTNWGLFSIEVAGDKYIWWLVVDINESSIEFVETSRRSVTSHANSAELR